MSSNNRFSSETLAYWDDELARAVGDLEEAEMYGDSGAIDWHNERIRWAKMKINNILDYQRHIKGA